MYYKVNSGIMLGMNAHLINVESDVSEGMPSIDLVGYLANEVREARERVKTAMKNSGYFIPAKKITINISPGNFKKSGTGFDLPIALSLLGCMDIITRDILNDTLCLGELGLNGEVKPIIGVLPRVLLAKEAGLKRVIIPHDNLCEGAVVEGIEVIGVKTLNETIDYLNNKCQIEGMQLSVEKMLQEYAGKEYIDFCQIKGQKALKRAMEIAAAGLHNLLMMGPPGAGKTLSAKALPSIMPPLSSEECLNISKIYSVAGLLDSGGIKLSRPFVNPHHTITPQALSGGGAIPKPGAVSLADQGVLFLDEIPEFRKETIEILRQPLEEKKIVISRANATYTYPADFLLVAAANPCRCGYYPDRNRCNCSEVEVKRYLGRLSGPLLDRIDICVQTKEVLFEDLVSIDNLSETSETIRQRVLSARERQKYRFKDDDISTNSHMSPPLIEKYCKLTKREEEIMERAFIKMQISARYFHKILKIARTIADLDESDNINPNHLYEAMGYRFSI